MKYSVSRMLREGKELERSASKHLTRVLSNLVSRDKLNPGDHIYSWRSAYSYAHHGIYIGDGKVIHFTRGEGQELGTGTFLDAVIQSSGSAPAHMGNGQCRDCGYHKDSNGVICSCINCFLYGCRLYRYDYGKSTIRFLANVRGGTCTLALSDPPELVIHRAKYLLQNGFRCYKLFRNNCEDFAMYCKTGLLIVKTNIVGAGGQAVTVVGAPLAAVVSSPVLLASPLGMVVVMAGMYCLSRYVADISVRPDVAKIPVEELVGQLSQHIPIAQHT